ncbi:MAG: FKBP-type peptidyl-prolyl cis-trans isomerase [Muribaculaceae bacterium]|nr:FKBP-type peptidyl-prolyl cis-trans isomerase [Muribaculaceae bacterium]MBQ6279257.1 FKBP-type peptidyl-prolyl cis-trans isomerase [Muribaculaceae bacterium]MBR0025364.1 FKBP-type peptidyl-prolyl cis-trans isomerase [Muribaculaceae bacterium]
MKKLPFILVLAMVLGTITTSCFKDDDPADEYSDWLVDNIEWYEQQEEQTNYYTKVTAPWDPAAEVLIHWYNDTTKTKGNLKPKFTSMVDVKYHLSLYDGTPIDSSFNSTSPADSLFRCRLNSGVIEGWAIAVPRMHIGDSCRVIIPYNVGYGTTSSGDIKPYSTLDFKIKLVGIPKYEQ